MNQSLLGAQPNDRVTDRIEEWRAIHWNHKFQKVVRPQLTETPLNTARVFGLSECLRRLWTRQMGSKSRE